MFFDSEVHSVLEEKAVLRRVSFLLEDINSHFAPFLARRRFYRMCARYKEQENEIFRRLRLSLLGSRGVELGRADLRSSSNGKGRDKKASEKSHEC